MAKSFFWASSILAGHTAAVFEIAHRGRMIGNRHFGIDGAGFGPLDKTWVKLRQLVDVDPDRLQHAAHHGVGQAFMADEIDIVGIGAGIFDDPDDEPALTTDR